MNHELQSQLEQLELGFWRATQDASYYEANMDNNGPAVFSDMFLTKDEAIDSTSGSRISQWIDVGFEEVRLLELPPHVAALVYRGLARRDGAPYSANVTTVYARRDGRWQMILHQQSANSQAG